MASKATQDKAAEAVRESVAHWWARESQNLFVTNGVRKVRFDLFKVTLDLADPVHREVNDMLEGHRSSGLDFFKVLSQENDKNQQKQMLAIIRELLNPPTDGYSDDVAKVSGVLKLAALFTDDELGEVGVRRTSPDVDLLTLEASTKKYIQGVE